MDELTHDLLYKDMLSISQTIERYARQIESGEHGETWTVEDLANDHTYTYRASSEDDALLAYRENEPLGPDDSELYIQHVEADEPTVDDTPISEYQYAIVDERGKPFSILLAGGGPHIEVEAEGLGAATLEGYWTGEHITMRGEHFSTFLDWFIER